ASRPIGRSDRKMPWANTNRGAVSLKSAVRGFPCRLQPTVQPLRANASAPPHHGRGILALAAALAARFRFLHLLRFPVGARTRSPRRRVDLPGLRIARRSLVVLACGLVVALAMLLIARGDCGRGPGSRAVPWFRARRPRCLVHDSLLSPQTA